MKGKSIRISFTITSLGLLLAFSCVAYMVHADNLTPQQRFQQLQNASSSHPQPPRADSHRASSSVSLRADHQQLHARTASSTTALEARLQQRITTIAAHVTERMQRVIDRLTQIKGRLETRMQLLAQQGVDTSAAQQKIDAATTNLNNATTALINIGSTVGTAVASSSPKEAWQAARAQYESIRTDLQTAHQDMIDALNALKTAAQAAGVGTGASAAVRQNQTPVPPTGTSSSATSSTN